MQYRTRGREGGRKQAFIFLISWILFPLTGSRKKKKERNQKAREDEM